MLRQTFFVTSVSIVFLLLLVGVTWGRSPQIHYGVIGGINLGRLALDEEIEKEMEEENMDRKARLGLGIGGFAEYPFTSMMSLRGGLLFLQKGEKWENITLKFNYLAIPVLVKAGALRVF